MSSTHSEELFETIGKDAQSWLEQARELKVVADAILPMLQAALCTPPALPGTQEKRFAFLHSYMLLTGLAFENLTKGILIGRDPTLVSRAKIKGGIMGRGGHGIADRAGKIITLTTNESSFLKRTEEYLVWAGRYPLPMTSGHFLNSKKNKLLSFCDGDPRLANTLFEKVTTILRKDWDARS
jgi:hypothetical protein